MAVININIGSMPVLTLALSRRGSCVVNWKIHKGNFMVTSIFWNTEFPDGEYSKSADEVQHINRILSTVAAQDIPAGKRGQVADYIHFAQQHETIEPAIKDKLEHLLDQLQELQAT